MPETTRSVALRDTIRNKAFMNFPMGEAHLRKLLLAYADYYDSYRTHLGLSKDGPLGRPVHRCGTIKPVPKLGGLHHAYVRI